jgi:hypothetical protein
MSISAVGLSDSAVVRTAATDDAPRMGDVLVVPEPEAQGRFAISQVPGMPSMSWDSRAKAVDAARVYARVHNVDVWLRNGGGVERLHAYRGPGLRSH